MKHYDVKINGNTSESFEVAEGAEPLAGHVIMTETELLEWVANRPIAVAEPIAWRVSKDTIISRVLSAGALTAVIAALAQQSREQQFVWANSAWFWSNNATLRQLCSAIGLDADAILAPDPFI